MCVRETEFHFWMSNVVERMFAALGKMLCYVFVGEMLTKNHNQNWILRQCLRIYLRWYDAMRCDAMYQDGCGWCAAGNEIFIHVLYFMWVVSTWFAHLFFLVDKKPNPLIEDGNFSEDQILRWFLEKMCLCFVVLQSKKIPFYSKYLEDEAFNLEHISRQN